MIFNIPKIVTPISHQFDNKVFAREIIAVSDFLEVRERSLESDWPNQRLFHIDIDITHKWDGKIKYYLKSAFEKKPELCLVTFQATRCCENEKIVNGIFQLDGKVYSRKEMLDNAKTNASWLKIILGNNIKIGLENNNYYPTEAYDIVTDGDFISEIVNQNDLYLLFDIAHALVTAHNRKIEYDSYIITLPMHKLVQLHICRPALPRGGIAYDAHDLPDDEMFNNVVLLLKKYPQIKYLTIEYYKDKDKLIKSIIKLRNLIKIDN